MSGIFSKPKIPPTPPIEVAQSATVDTQQVERERGDLMRRRRGRAATVLTGGDSAGGAAAPGSVAIKSLLGQ